jgi:transcription-repair coupling factor (superfamily II helicase)
MGAQTPLRIDLFDDEIEAIREFDPDTQRSGASLGKVRMLPGRELPLDADSVKASGCVIASASKATPRAA